jgi:two-component sensor histidine kinase
MISLDWRESGVGARPSEPRKGFGNLLMGAFIEKQLGGRISREWLDEGLRLRVELPSFNRVGGSLNSRP